VSALIDTGASASAVKTGVAAGLGLKPVGSARVHTPSSKSVICLQFMLQLVFPNGHHQDCLVIEAPLHSGQESTQFLIGRDVLRHAVFIYSGAIDSLSLSF
jgi:hypothetical protein